jgi:hypothetical protein
MKSTAWAWFLAIVLFWPGSTARADSLTIKSIELSPSRPKAGATCVAYVRIMNLAAPIQSVSQSRDMGFISLWADRDGGPKRRDEKSATISRYIGRMRRGQTKTIKIPFKAPARDGRYTLWVRVPEPSQKDIGYTDSHSYTVGSPPKRTSRTSKQDRKRTAKEGFDFSNDWDGRQNMRVMSGTWRDKKGQSFTLRMDGTASGILGEGHWTVKSPRYLNKVQKGHQVFHVLYIYNPKTREIVSASSIPYIPRVAKEKTTEYGFKMTKGDFLMGVSSRRARKRGTGAVMFLKRK